MATTLGTIRTNARIRLLETTAKFWTDAELLTYIIDGVKDLWGSVVELDQEHFVTEDATNVSQAASATTLTGVPSDCFRISRIEPRDLTEVTGNRNVMYVPRDLNHRDFISARSRGTLDPSSGGVVCYKPLQAGPPVGTMTVRVAPVLSTAVTLRLFYVPSLNVATLTANDNNPIPGESDNALVAWCCAYARAKEREDRSPDPNQLAVYKTEKDNILTRLKPRQTQEPEVVEGVFEEEWE
jgi:hypothetical protein